jgi:hypothetical protein
MKSGWPKKLDHVKTSGKFHAGTHKKGGKGK